MTAEGTASAQASALAQQINQTLVPTLEGLKEQAQNLMAQAAAISGQITGAGGEHAGVVGGVLLTFHEAMEDAQGVALRAAGACEEWAQIIAAAG